MKQQGTTRVALQWLAAGAALAAAYATYIAIVRRRYGRVRPTVGGNAHPLPADGQPARSRYARLSAIDHMQLRAERLESPTHIGGLCVLEASPLLDTHGELDLQMVTRHLERRLARLPELRRVVHPAPPLCGRPLWVDDPDFSLARHIHTATAAAPGDEASLLETAELLMRPLLDRSRPLWELWFITGLVGGRVGLLFKLHHAIADGVAAVALISSFFDMAPDAPEPPAAVWTPTPPPTTSALLADNLRCRATATVGALRQPGRVARGAASMVAYIARTIPEWAAAPQTSLNTLVQSGRHIRVMRLDLEAARAVGHAHGATINDVVLSVVAGGVRELLVARGERADDLRLIAAIPANMRGAGKARELGNVVAALAVRLPPAEADAGLRLEHIAAATRDAKTTQRLSQPNTNVALGVVGWLAAHGISFVAGQRMINFLVADLVGPTQPLYVLGARIEEVMPLSGPFGNVTLTFGAMSYCERLTVITMADRSACPDVDILDAGMRRAWAELAGVATPA